MQESVNRVAKPSTLGATEAREKFAEVLGRVAFAKERIILTRNRQRMGVLVPMEDYERLRQLDRSAGDGKAARP